VRRLFIPAPHVFRRQIEQSRVFGSCYYEAHERVGVRVSLRFRRLGVVSSASFPRAVLRRRVRRATIFAQWLGTRDSPEQRRISDPICPIGWLGVWTLRFYFSTDRSTADPCWRCERDLLPSGISMILAILRARRLTGVLVFFQYWVSERGLRFTWIIENREGTGVMLLEGSPDVQFTICLMGDSAQSPLCYP